jgi:hypothetical protein
MSFFIIHIIVEQNYGLSKCRKLIFFKKVYDELILLKYICIIFYICPRMLIARINKQSIIFN